MQDNTNLGNEHVPSQVTLNDEYAIQYLAERYGVSTNEVKNIIKEIGNNRQEIEEALISRNSK